MMRRAYLAVLPAVLVLACNSHGCSRYLPGRGGAPAEPTGPFVPIPKVSAPTPPPEGLQGTTGAASSPIGTNLSEFHEWSSEWAALDAFKQSRVWISGMGATWETTEPLDLDEHGWVRSLKPDQIARALLFWGGQPYPGGNYDVYYEGEGHLEYFHNDNVISREPGHDVIRLDPKKGGVGVLIVKTNPSNYVRNIRVLPSGGACSSDPTTWCQQDAQCGSGTCQPFAQHSSEQLFHPVFLKSLTPFSAVRFMNWMATNNSEQARWADRPKPDDAHWTTKGVPVEIMVALANKVHVDPWFCMPHKADDDYVRNFATYVRDHLAPGRKAYVEHSNEVWNGAFTQHGYAAEMAAKMKDAKGDRFEQQMQWHAARSRHIFEIWHQVFGADAKQRVVRVLGSWAAQPHVSESLLTSGDTYKVTDALAIAPYFGHEIGSKDLTLDEAFQTAVPREIEVTRAYTAATAEVAKKHGVELIAYEGGQHLVVYGEAQNVVHINKLLDDLNRDPRMQAAYERYFDMWRSVGGRLMMHYENVEAYGVFGRWGARESLMQPVQEAPKLCAILAWSRKNPRWW
jgi:hypothetical protein